MNEARAIIGYAIEPEHRALIIGVMRRLYGPHSLKPGEMRDLAHRLDLAVNQYMTPIYQEEG